MQENQKWVFFLNTVLIEGLIAANNNKMPNSLYETNLVKSRQMAAQTPVSNKSLRVLVMPKS